MFSSYTYNIYVVCVAIIFIVRLYLRICTYTHNYHIEENVIAKI